MPNALWRMSHKFYFLYTNPGLCKALPNCRGPWCHFKYPQPHWSTVGVFKTHLVSKIKDVHERKGLAILCLMHSCLEGPHTLARRPDSWLVSGGSQKPERHMSFILALVKQESPESSPWTVLTAWNVFFILRALVKFTGDSVDILKITDVLKSPEGPGPLPFHLPSALGRASNC